MAESGDALERPMSRREFLRLPHLLRGRIQQFASATPPAPSASWSPNARGVVDAGGLDELLRLPPGTVETRFAASGRFYLVRTDEGILAVARVCQAPGCAVLWQPNMPAVAADQERGWTRGRFFCLQHRATYDRYGQPATAAPGALDRYTVRSVNGRVLVDTTAPVVGADSG